MAQQKEADSLRYLLMEYTQKDSVRLGILNELAYTLHQLDPDNGLTVSSEAINLAKELKAYRGLAFAFSTKGHNYKVLGKDSLAIEMYNEAIRIHTMLNNRSGVAKTLFNIGMVHFNNSKYKLANEYQYKALAYFEEQKDSAVTAHILNSIAINYMYMSDYSKSLEIFFNALKIYNSLEHKNWMALGNISTNIALLYKHQQKYGLAEDYHNKALKLFEENNYKKGIANSLSGLGVIHNETNRPDKAIAYLKKAIAISESINDVHGTANDYTNLGIAYFEIENYNQAIDILYRSEKAYKELNNINNLSIVYTNLGKCFFYKDDPVYDLAEKYLLQAIGTAKKVNSLENEATAWDNLSDLYKKQSDYKNAFNAKEHFLSLNDSINSITQKEEIARLEADYEYSKKEIALQIGHEKERALAKAEIEKQKIIKNSAIVGGGSLLLISFIGFLLYKRKQEAIIKKEISEFNEKVAETELKALRAQLNPHFIFNSLNSISSYISVNETKKAKEYLAKFASLMRKILENSEKKEIFLNEDIELLGTYLDIENKRLNGKFTYLITIDPNIDPFNTLVPPLIVQPFIENSIWHGISHKTGKGHIKIDVAQKDDTIIYAVEDDGIGMNNDGNTPGKKSYGFEITKSRVDIINHQKKSNGKISIIEKDNGVRVEVQIPLELAF